jgi:hypothetical protein
VVLRSFAQVSQAAPAKPESQRLILSRDEQGGDLRKPRYADNTNPRRTSGGSTHRAGSHTDAVKFIADQLGHEDVPFVE